MNEIRNNNQLSTPGIIALAAVFALLYATVISKLTMDWWTDENYSHGLLIPFVIAIIIWREWDSLRIAARDAQVWLGGSICLTALLLLFAGVLGAELFTTRISMVLMLAGVVVYLFGTRVLRALSIAFVLLLLAIPIPQILFNRIAFPLQIWASKMAVWGIRLFDVPTTRSGNVIDILPSGAIQAISLEVVEACSGIRSLMTLVTLALLLAYFTRRSSGRNGALSTSDLWRAVVLMISAAPIAVLTNAGRVTATGILTYHYGKQATLSTWHDLSGWVVYLVALALLVVTNLILMRVFRANSRARDIGHGFYGRGVSGRILPLLVLLAAGALTVTWLNNRGEAEIGHPPLSELSSNLGDWQQIGGNIIFDTQVEGVLRTSDYVMREYSLPEGRIANLYVGFYASQRAGATYHSPQNCLPGAGWVMSDPQHVDIPTRDGRVFSANRYVVENGIYHEVMIYWYQGRGRTESSEYRDKLNTIWDSVTRRRSDGALVRVMTSTAGDQTAAIEAAVDLSARLAENLSPFIPE
jgi:exosortase D (VPLPA-CTERM-specific)